MTAEIANGTMTETLPAVKSRIDGDVVPNGKKSSRENERRRRRRKQKKNKNPTRSSADGSDRTPTEDSEGDTAEDDPHQVEEKVEIEYVPEKAEVEDNILEDFKKIFEKFSFNDASSGAEGDDKQDENAQTEASKKKADLDSDEEDLDTPQKERGGLSNKKKKLQRRMKIAELKQICSRPDVVEV